MEEEPDESATEEEYLAWENNNPTWQMESELKCYLDSDFIETITENKFEYLGGIVKASSDIEMLKNRLTEEKTVLVLIFDNAISAPDVTLSSTEKLEYFGYFQSNI